VAFQPAERGATLRSSVNAVAPAKARAIFLAAAWSKPPSAVLDALPLDAAASPAWEGAAALARRTNQEPVFLEFAERHAPRAPLSLDVLADLALQTRVHAFRWAEIRACVEALLARLEVKAVRPILLKGVSLAGERFDPPHLRPMRDVDILVRPEETEIACAAAQESGFFPDAARHPAWRYDGHHHLPPLFHRDTGVCLEIHRTVVGSPERIAGFPPLEDFLRGLRSSRCFPRAALLAPTLELLVTCAQVTHGDSIGRRAQYLFDLARELEGQESAIDWEQIVALARSPDVARVLFVPLGYLAAEGMPSPPPAILETLRRASRLRGWEIRLLGSLTSRYRIGAPGPWPWISGRVSNVIWRQTLEQRSLLWRTFSTGARILRRSSVTGPSAGTLERTP
jgi:hypothetical protein